MLSVYVVFTLLLSILWITTMARFLGNQLQCENPSNQIRQIISVGGERRSGQRRKPGRFFDSFPSKRCQTNPLPLLLSSYCKSCVKSSPKVFEGEKRLQQRCLLMYHRKLPVVATRLGWQHKTADTAATWHGRMGHRYRRSSNLLKNVDDNKVNFGETAPDYDDCTVRKSHQLANPKTIDRKFQRVFQLHGYDRFHGTIHAEGALGLQVCLQDLR